jgi:hypothetical protein
MSEPTPRQNTPAGSALRKVKPFPLGKLVITAGVKALLQEKPDRAAMIKKIIARHSIGDSGALPEDDVLANLRAIVEGDARVVSSYVFKFGKLYVITEADRSRTTVLRAEEY